MLAVHAALLLPVLLGRGLRTPSGATSKGIRLALCGVAPATAFFLVSNWAVWQFQSNYEPTLSGLVACYTAALPFYRAMLAGDIFYGVLLLGCYAMAAASLRRPVVQHAEARSGRS